MNQNQVEKRLSWCYGLLVICLSVSVVCVAVTYSHWRETLDVCPGSWLENTSCGCILYGLSTSQYFNGGHNSYCLYAILAPVPILVYAIIMTLFHMYRVCINNIGKYEDEKTTTVEEIEGESIMVTSRTKVSHRSDNVIYCWIPNACFAAFFCIYNLVHSSILTDGYLKTCSQYRGYFVNVIPILANDDLLQILSALKEQECHRFWWWELLPLDKKKHVLSLTEPPLPMQSRASGDHASAIHFRLSCHSMFDFMDYLQKDSPNSRRGVFINTGLALELAIISSWIAVGLWIAIVIYTAKRAYNERHALTCCGN